MSSPHAPPTLMVKLAPSPPALWYSQNPALAFPRSGRWVRV